MNQPTDAIPAQGNHTQLESLLAQIEALPENWNSYGAARISHWSIAQAAMTIKEALNLGLPLPAVSPASGASIGIEWKTPNAELLLDIDPQQGITYLIVDHARGTELEGELTADNQSGIIRKFTGIQDSAS